MIDGKAFQVDHATLQHAIRLLEGRLQAVVDYGSGGCAACHDAELRGAIALLRRLMGPAAPAATANVVVSTSKSRRR
jgi:hypothetical protein